MVERWSLSRAKSAAVLRWILLNSRLRFQFLDFAWWCRQARGTQHGGTHSPTLFSRLVAARFDELVSRWAAGGELPAFAAGACALWALWFIDDSLLFFRNVAQMYRLMPQVVAFLADLGLSINFSKSCLLGACLPPRLRGLLEPLAAVASSTYLGLPLCVVEAGGRVAVTLCHKATAAFFSKRPLLTNQSAPRCSRLRLFDALVTASIRWSLCVVTVNQATLSQFRVHFCTLLTWMLGARAHASWFSVQCISALRHAVKLWGRVFALPWDRLLASMVWRWIGHVLRMPPISLVRQVLLSLTNTNASQHHLRRHGTGPNNSGHRSVLRYLQHQGLSVAAANDRQQWRDWEAGWLQHLGIYDGPAHVNAFAISSDAFLWDFRCAQGAFSGQQVLVCVVSDDGAHWYLELDRALGWRVARGHNRSETVQALLQDAWQTGWLRVQTFHVRVLLFHFDEVSDRASALLLQLPARHLESYSRQIVFEVSLFPATWRRRMKRIVELYVQQSC
eukprot:Skav230897  [mRNA]  locus=scaffold2765:216083:217597:- [translate_table: standard]